MTRASLGLLFVSVSSVVACSRVAAPTAHAPDAAHQPDAEVDATPAEADATAIRAAVAHVRRPVRFDLPRPEARPTSILARDLPHGAPSPRRGADLFVARSLDDGGVRQALVDVRGAPIGQVHGLGTIAPTGRPYGQSTGLALACVAVAPTPVGWESLRVDASGRGAWTTGEGTFDGRACAARALHAETHAAAPLLDGAVFAFVRCDADCARASLVVLFPDPLTLATSDAVAPPEHTSPVTAITLPLGARGAWAAAQVRTRVVEDFEAGARGAPGTSSDDAPPGTELFVVEALATDAPLHAEILAYHVALADDAAPRE